MRHKRLWLTLGLVVVASFAVLIAEGLKLTREMPPLPGEVLAADGTKLFDRETILDGQNAWQSIGGQQVGSVWGHGAYVAPDWSADWLHRESVFLLDRWARVEGHASWEVAPAETQAALQARLQGLMRTNGYDAENDRLVLPPERVEAFAEVGAHFTDVFLNGRAEYAIPPGALKDPEKLKAMNAFFFWSSWAASTNRPGQNVSYTQNWPHEPLVANVAVPGAVMWTFISIILLLAGVGALVWYVSRQKDEHDEPIPERDPFSGLKLTPSQRATFKYFAVVGVMMLAQVGLGILTAHYGVEGHALFGIPLAEILPYSVTRSWHTQLGVLWIATAWLATGLFVGPAVTGQEPKYQRAGVNFLFVCLLVIVAGSMAGQWLSVQQKLGGNVWYWLGHQGWEYVDIGRFWQIFLFVGLFVWLFLTARAIWPALRAPSEHRPLLVLFALSAGAIALFYGAGLMYGQRSHISIVEYWRWWVVHLWVEGFFEVFATVVMSFLFVRMGLMRAKVATPLVLFSTIIFLAGGILGTFHHLYFSGTSTSILAIGASFSALEIVPLVLVGREVWPQIRMSKAGGWLADYKWPILFFISVAFWNLVGAGVFGFLINPPIALYYMQGLNLTPLHGHTALFGVYGMLGIGLMLFCLRLMTHGLRWNEKLLKWGFWSLNGGLVAMSVMSLLPIGLLQTWAAVEHGTWFARSAEFLQTPLMDTLRWLRAPGDTIFAVGMGLITWFVIGLKTGWSLQPAGGTGDVRELGPGGVAAPLPARMAPQQKVK